MQGWGIDMEEAKMLAEIGGVLFAAYLMLKFSIERERKVMVHFFDAWERREKYTDERFRKVDAYLLEKLEIIEKGEKIK